MLRGLSTILLCASIGACSSSSTGEREQHSRSIGVPDGGFPDSGEEPTPTGDTFDGPGGSCKLTLEYGSTECRACMNESCCAPVAACEADAECRAMHECVTDCTSYPDDATACAKACMPKGESTLFAAVHSCWLDKPCGKFCAWPKL